jgi:hypothetical protein
VIQEDAIKVSTGHQGARVCFRIGGMRADQEGNDRAAGGL